jgi:hypothetical protein
VDEVVTAAAVEVALRGMDIPCHRKGLNTTPPSIWHLNSGTMRLLPRRPLPQARPTSASSFLAGHSSHQYKAFRLQLRRRLHRGGQARRRAKGKMALLLSTQLCSLRCSVTCNHKEPSSSGEGSNHHHLLHQDMVNKIYGVFSHEKLMFFLVNIWHQRRYAW